MLVSLNVTVKAGQPSTHFQPCWVEDGSERGPSDMHWPFQGKQEQIPAGSKEPFSDRESTIAVKACLHIAFVCSHWTKQRRHKATLILYCDWDPDPPFIVESKTFFFAQNCITYSPSVKGGLWLRERERDACSEGLTESWLCFQVKFGDFISYTNFAWNRVT